MPVFEHYRRGAGRRARSIATIILLCLVTWFAYALMEYGNTRLDRLLGLEDPFFGRRLVAGGGILTEWITPSLVISLVLFAIGLVWVRGFLNRPKFADLLIATEAELKRVRWAPKKDTTKATVVVLYFVLWFSIIMFVYDLTFSMGVGLIQQRKWNEVGWGRIVAMIFRIEDTPEDGQPAFLEEGDN